MHWYYVAKDQSVGPIDDDGMGELVGNGTITPSTYVWHKGMSGWVAAADSDLGRNFPATAPAGMEQSTPLDGQTGTSPSAYHWLTTYPVALAVVLHYVTFGVFTFFWLNLMHEKICRVRPDDPSAGRALGYCFIPFFNIYWRFFSYRRLCLRVAEQRELYGLPPGNLSGLATTACVFHFIPYINIWFGFTVITPIFLGMMQSHVNQLVLTSATTAPQTALPFSTQPVKRLSASAITAIVCAFIILHIAVLTALAIPAAARVRDMSQRNACIDNMRMIDDAKDIAAMEHNYPDGKILTAQQTSEFMKVRVSNLVCPTGGRYTVNPIGEDPECSVHGSLSDAMQENREFSGRGRQ